MEFVGDRFDLQRRLFGSMRTGKGMFIPEHFQGIVEIRVADDGGLMPQLGVWGVYEK